MIRKNDRAVSPVVGVMLMLVVTIILAAVVSAFAGGMAGDQEIAPQATIKAESAVNDPIKDTDTANYNPNYPDDFSAANGILFENMGGDTFMLNEIKVQLLNQGVTMTVTPGNRVDYSDPYVCLPEDVTDGGYFAKIGSSVDDMVIEPGDKFMLYADACYITDEDDITQKYISWELSSRGYGPLGEMFEWKVIDTNSDSVIATGKLVLQ
ncbi:type IV pilin N-terminal domain-containing protein [Methanolacinia paynteri]|uniref:type IV pilin N-terminal domain-containing protein n=1 Tax=Methanolacinia paynteri TaxID=230356 RepID=UPI00064E3675|nr:type IV pilin N-terminal domain-containing protein [Methanolacinia paynteri]